MSLAGTDLKVQAGFLLERYFLGNLLDSSGVTAAYRFIMCTRLCRQVMPDTRSTAS